MSGVSLLTAVILGQAVCVALVIAVLFFLSDAVLRKEALAGLYEEKGWNQEHLESVTVMTARPISSEQKSHFIKVIGEQTGLPASRIEFKQDPSLWAGLMIEAHGHVLDYSLRGRLRRAFNER